MLELKKIHKSFGHKEVLHDISLKVDEPQIYGLIGPNGAGKTTMMRIICGILPFSTGTIEYSGHSLSDIAYMPDSIGLYTDMTVIDEIKYMGQLHGLTAEKAVTRAKPFLRRLDLIHYQNTLVGTLSKGTMRKIQFICTFLVEPYMAILDEPFDGLDPISAMEMERIIIEKKQQGIPIFLSTHQMDLAERFCDHIFLINQGRLLIDDDLERLKLRHLHQEFLVEALCDIRFPESHIMRRQHEDGKVWQWIISIDKSFTYQQMVGRIGDTELLSLRRLMPSLKEIFVKAVKQS